MPAIKLIDGCGPGLTSRPFAGDDLQIMCLIGAVYRLIQMACLLPFWVKLFLIRLNGQSLVGPSGEPSWCHTGDQPLKLLLFNYSSSDESVAVSVGADEEEEHATTVTGEMMISISSYLIITAVYNVVDVTLSLAVWSAASVGTPIEPRGRDVALRSLFFVKIVLMNLLLCCILASGLFFVAVGRSHNYGCENEDEESAVSKFEQTPWYAMFTVVMITYAFELLLWPCLSMNQLGRAVTSLHARYDPFNSEDGRHRKITALLGCSIRCLQCLSCNRMGGGRVKIQSDLTDAAVALIDFFNLDTNFNITMSDVWVCLKLLGRERRQTRYELSEQAKNDANNHLIRPADENICLETRPTRFGFESEVSRNLTEDGFGDRGRKVLQPNHSHDMKRLREAARYSRYANGVYSDIPSSLYREGLMHSLNGLYHPLEIERNDLNVCYSLECFGMPRSLVAYASYEADVIKTPYCILIDLEAESVVIAVMGSATLEDMVTDMQFSPVRMDKVGMVCGFDAEGKFCHRGMLTKSKFIFNDLKRRGVLKLLLPLDDVVDETELHCRGFDLVFTGHSLGGGIAAILGMMHRNCYPNLHVYAYCPPGCTASVNVLLECEEYVTSIVVGNDLVPRIRDANFEIFRFEFLEMLARIKVSKMVAFNDIRVPCRNRDLKRRNEDILYSSGEVPPSDYCNAVKSLKERRFHDFNSVISPLEQRLDIPGKIIHLVHVDRSDKYLPYWESRHALREINLGTKIVMEHSADRLVSILRTIVDDFEEVAMGQGELISDGSLDVTSANDTYEPCYGAGFSAECYSAEDRWFIICSCPLGLVSLVPTLLSITAFVLSLVGNNLCNLFRRNVSHGPIYFSSDLTLGNAEEVVDVTLGLYTHGVAYLAESSEVLQCSNASSENEMEEEDAYIKMAVGQVLYLVRPQAGNLPLA